MTATRSARCTTGRYLPSKRTGPHSTLPRWGKYKSGVLLHNTIVWRCHPSWRELQTEPVKNERDQVFLKEVHVEPNGE